MAQATEKRIPHLEGCPAKRTERYTQAGPKGTFEIHRCIDCGEQTTEPKE